MALITLISHIPLIQTPLVHPTVCASGIRACDVPALPCDCACRTLTLPALCPAFHFPVRTGTSHRPSIKVGSAGQIRHSDVCSPVRPPTPSDPRSAHLIVGGPPRGKPLFTHTQSFTSHFSVRVSGECTCRRRFCGSQCAKLSWVVGVGSG